MHILVINSGSSSIKFSVFQAGAGEPASLFDGEVSGIGGAKSEFRFRDAAGRDLSNAQPKKAGSLQEAIATVEDAVSGEGMPRIDAVGYRVVHPGAKLDRHVRITDEVMQDLEDAGAFAPLHDPSAIEMIRETRARFPKVPHYACFDTVFHRTMTEAATAYAIPAEYRERGARRYGFHGLSCESVVWQLRKAKIRLPQRMIIAHLGSGCSVTAVMGGRSADTTMGLTPTGGVVMGTRPGDLDPGLVFYLLRQQNRDYVGVTAVETMLNRQSGIVALSGLPNDMREVRKAADKRDRRASLALEIFTRSIKKAIGSFMALMGGVDAIVFTGGIGEHDARTRMEILAGLEELGIVVDAGLNAVGGQGVWRMSASDFKTAIFVVPAKEDLMIAVHVDRMMKAGE